MDWNNPVEKRKYNTERMREKRAKLYANPQAYKEWKDITNKARRERYATDQVYKERVLEGRKVYYENNREKCIQRSIKTFRERKYWLRPYKKNYQQRYFKNVYWMYRGKGGGIQENGGRDFMFEFEMRNYVCSEWIQKIAPKDSMTFYPIRINKVWKRYFLWKTWQWQGWWTNIHQYVEEGSEEEKQILKMLKEVGAPLTTKVREFPHRRVKRKSQEPHLSSKEQARRLDPSGKDGA